MTQNSVELVKNKLKGVNIWKVKMKEIVFIPYSMSMIFGGNMKWSREKVEELRKTTESEWERMGNELGRGFRVYVAPYKSSQNYWLLSNYERTYSNYRVFVMFENLQSVK